jgi:hypothetical protein
MPEGNSKRESMETDDDDDDDVFLESLKKRPTRTMRLDDALEPEALSSQRRLLLERAPAFERHPMIGPEPSTDVALVLHAVDESDLWVDTDSASADDGNSETISPLQTIPL